eukprot:4133-Heterococcus_DN1.PRE.1
MQSAAKTTKEVHYIDLNSVQGAAQHELLKLSLLQRRVTDLRYSAEHHGDHFYIVTNADGARESKLVRCPLSATTKDHWEDVQPYDPTRKIDGILCFENHLLLTGRQGGLNQMWVLDPASGESHKIDQPEAACSARPHSNYVYNTSTLRFGYSSLVSPSATYDYDMATKTRKLLKEKEVPGYDRSQYKCERLAATAKDGTTIPMSIVYRKDLYPEGPRNCHAPTMLYGYGCYGASIEPDFDSTRLSYLDRGMCYIIAHIRGGGEMGRAAYEDGGRMLSKLNTYTDFIACAEHCIAEGITEPSKLAICGRSAGGTESILPSYIPSSLRVPHEYT